MDNIFCKTRAFAERKPTMGLFILLLVVSFLTPAFALTGDEVSLPLAGRKNPSKVRLSVNTRGIDAPGYRGVKLKATLTTAPLTDDRSFRIVLYPNRQDPFTGFDQAVTGYLEIPAGSLSGQATILVPQDEYWYQMQIDVYEYGRKLPDLSESFGINRTNWQTYGEMPAILFIDKDVPPAAERENAVQLRRRSAWNGEETHKLPDFRGVLSNFLNQSNNWGNPNPPPTTDFQQKVPDIELLMQMADQQMLDMLPLAEVPTRWLELSCFDLIFISRSDLAELAESHPSRFKAVRDWLATGPVLCVYDGGGDEYEHLPQIEKLLQLQVAPETTKEDNIRGWQFAYDRLDGSLLQPRLRNGNRGYYNAGKRGAIGQKNNGVRQKFVTCDADLGKVVVFKEDNIFPGADDQWLILLNTVTPTHWHHSTRNGVSGQNANPHYWEFLIPGVGEAPVMSFVILITLFMIAIGPVNYWVLRRLQRSYLLLITVPLGAFIVTLGLFSYALLTEGFQVRSRLRSYTWLDAQQGRATSVSRQSYYASLTPSAGLMYSTNDAVYPLIAQPERYNRSNFGRELIWDEDRQQLKSNYVYPRTVAQFVVHGTNASTARLEVLGPKGKLADRKVVNHLGCHIKYLRVFDTAGNLYGENIAADEKADLQTAWSESGFDWTKYLDTHQPREPSEFNPTRSNLLAVVFGRGAMMPAIWNGGMSNEPSLLETRLTAVKGAANIPPGSFIAIVERPESVALGLKSSHEKASLHVIQGNW